LNPVLSYVYPEEDYPGLYPGIAGLGQAISPGDQVECDATGNCFNLTTGEIVAYGGTTGATPSSSPVSVPGGAGNPPCVFSNTPVQLLPNQVYCGTGTTTPPSAGPAPAPITTGMLAVAMGGIFLLFLVMGARRA
jgi:hypothetical protein